MPDILNASSSSTGGGLVNNISNKIKYPSLLAKEVNKPDYATGDFPEGFRIIEIIKGKEQTEDAIFLTGNMLPKDTLDFGGEQRVIKDYYPGYSEPTVQILGPKESDITIKGTIKDKKYKEKKFKHISTDIQRQIDGIRLRGNLLKITLGNWKRYGFLEETRFSLKNLGYINYELKFSIIGFNPPKNCLFIDEDLHVPSDVNKELIKAAENFSANYTAIPKEVPRTIGEFLNDAISVVAGPIATATSFVDTVLSTGTQTVSSVQRAVGLVKNARANISAFKRKIGTIGYNISTLGGKAQKVGKRISYTYIGAGHYLGAFSAMNSLAILMAQLQAQLEVLKKTVPLARYRVIDGDTLQKISNKFYGNPDDWKSIYDHNKLTNTALTVGAVLEIPKL